VPPLFVSALGSFGLLTAIHGGVNNHLALWVGYVPLQTCVCVG